MEVVLLGFLMWSVLVTGREEAEGRAESSCRADVRSVSLSIPREEVRDMSNMPPQCGQSLAWAESCREAVPSCHLGLDDCKGIS